MIIISNIVKNTYINSEGHKLYIELLPFIKEQKKIDLSFVGLTPMSTSFLNSSIGALIDEFGFDLFKNTIHPVEITKSHAEVLSRYIKSL